MLLNLTLNNAAGDDQRSVRMRLDFTQRAWSVDDDGDAWDVVGFSDSGSFEIKPANGALWLWDDDGGEKHNTVIIRDAPNSEADDDHVSGSARIFDPQDAAFKDGQIKWTVEQRESSAAPALTPTPSTTQPGELSERRKLIRDVILPAVKDSVYPDARFHKLVDTMTPEAFPLPYTTCGTLPAYVAKQLGGIGKIASGGLDKLREAGRDAGSDVWVVADGTRRPRLGDLYGLLEVGDRDIENGTIAHVGVIVDASGGRWKTVDAGQSDGKRIGWTCLAMERQYDEQAGTLSDNVRLMVQKHHVLAGWIDVDAYPFAKP